MNYAIIDLEFTAWKGSLERNWGLPWEKKEIIQIGAIKFNNFNNFSSKHLDLYIKPNFNKQLSFYIQRLTNVNQNKINQLGIPMTKANIILNNFFKDVKNIFCNGFDKEILIDNYKMLKIHPPKYTRNIYNIKPFLASYLKTEKEQLVSGQLHNFFKIENNNQGHNALNDCTNIFNCLKKINNIEEELKKITE